MGRAMGLLTALAMVGDAWAIDHNARRIERAAPSRAVALYCVAAMNGDAEAAYALGRMYLGGRGVRRNAGMGVAWLNEAARLGKRGVRAPTVAGTPQRPFCLVQRGAAPRRAPPEEIAAIARAAAQRHGLDAALVLAIMRIESNFDPRALSPKGAMGLMQLMPGTAKRFGVGKPYDPVQNVNGGSAYLRFLLDLYDGDVVRTAAAYNAGEGAVARYDGVPPYDETQAYIEALAAIYPHRRHRSDQTAEALSVEWTESQEARSEGLFERPAGAGR